MERVGHGECYYRWMVINLNWIVETIWEGNKEEKIKLRWVVKLDEWKCNEIKYRIEGSESNALLMLKGLKVQKQYKMSEC